MSKSIKVLLLTLLALCLAFSAAFAETKALVVSLDAGQKLEGTRPETSTPVTFKVGDGTLTATGLVIATAGAANDTELALKLKLSAALTAENVAKAAKDTAVALTAGSTPVTFKVGDGTLTATGLVIATAGAANDTELALKLKLSAALTAENVAKAAKDTAVTLTAGGTPVTFKIGDGTLTATGLVIATAGAANDTELELKLKLSAALTAENVAKAAKDTAVTLTATEAQSDLAFTLGAAQTVAGSYDTTTMVFTASPDAYITGENAAEKAVSIDLGGKLFKLTQGTPETSFSITSKDMELTVYVEGTADGVYEFATFALKGSADVTTTEAFDKASFDVYAAGKKVATVTFTSKDAEESVTVSTDVTVSFDLSKAGEVLKVASGDTEIVSKDGVYSLDIAKVAKIVTIKFASGDNGGSFDVKLTISPETGSSSSETYLLNLKGTTFKFTGSNGQSASFDAKTSTYATSSALASVDASGSWGTMSFTVSSDVFSDFTVSVDFPASASVAAVYYREGTTGSYTDAADDYTAKVLTPYVGYYKMVFSADLVASSDSSASGKSGYFGFTIQVASVDSGSSTTLVEESAASVEPVTRSDGNKEIPAGRKISTKFLSSNGTLTAAIVSAFFNSNNATSVEMATPEEITAALSKLGFTASDLGDAESGYKIVGLTLPDNVTLRDGMKFFVMITTDKDGSGKSALGMGVLSSKQIGLGFLPIVFKLLKNPANTNNYMTFDADEYFVGATNDMGESSSSTSARVVFVTADDQTFTIAADEKTLLQGQNASGDAQAYTGDDDDDDDNQETSSHGSSSGCDAGFGALALLAVAGALAARKVRK